MMKRLLPRRVIAVEVIVLSCLFALLGYGYLTVIFPRQRERQRLNQCMANVRQLTMAVEQYYQDHHRYPGVYWHNDIEKYLTDHTVTRCPSAASSDHTEEIDYGYNSLLVRLDSDKGAAASSRSDAMVMAPQEVGAIADAWPMTKWRQGYSLHKPKPTLLGGDGMGIAKAGGLDPCHNGIVIGYCDGHVEFVKGKRADLNNLAYTPARAFYHALALGLVRNYAGGLSDIPVSPTTSTIVIGGDSAGMPLLMTAAEAWAVKGGKWFCRGFTGSGDYANGRKAAFTDYRRAVRSRHYAWLTADGTSGGTPVARDALVVIVSKRSKIVSLTAAQYDASSAEVVSLFSTPSAAGKLQIYTYDAANGNRRYLAGALRQWGAVKGKEYGAGARVVPDDLAMVATVAADPYGIGYCSSSAADITKVTILAIGGKRYPNQNPKYPTLVPTTPDLIPGEFEYPLIRTLYLHTGGDGKHLAAIMRHEKFYQYDWFSPAPLFAASYFRP